MGIFANLFKVDKTFGINPVNKKFNFVLPKGYNFKEGDVMYLDYGEEICIVKKTIDKRKRSMPDYLL